MKKSLVLYVFFALLCLCGCLTIPKPLNVVLADTPDNFIVTAYGDSIAYGHGLQDLNNAYPAVFAQPYKQTFNGNVVYKAKSGDKTNDLLQKLEPYTNGTAEDMDSFYDTDIVTLCIGANNILGPAMDKIGDFLTKRLSENDFQALLDAGINQFEADYPKILNTFTGKKIVVMTIYNPYKYSHLTDISISQELQQSESEIRTALAAYDLKFTRMLEMSMTALQNINNQIRNSQSKDICVVDIWTMFENFKSEQYKLYINADMSKIVLDSSDVDAILCNNFNTLMEKFTTHCDPHPTTMGHAVIAQKHLDTFKYFKISTDKNLAALKNSNDKITLSITTIDQNNYNYKVYLETSSGRELIKESNSSEIEIDASKFAGNGNLYVEIYSNNEIVATSNVINYNCNFGGLSVTILYCALGVIGVILILCFIPLIVKKRKSYA